jgi:hypothetical protein
MIMIRPAFTPMAASFARGSASMMAPSSTAPADCRRMSSHRIARAVPREDFSVDIEWTSGERSVVDFKPAIAKGGLLASLGEPANFLRRMHVHSQGDSIAWEVFGQIVDFHADNLWRDSRRESAAAE